MEGWIKLHRDIMNHWIWSKDKQFDSRSAWIDLLLLANHKDNKFILGNEVILVERGSFITSELKLMKRWNWSKSKVRSFLKLLQNDSMIVKKTDQKKTTLTICNYDVWQIPETNKEPQKDQSETSERPQKDTNKNVKNDNNEKKETIINDFFESVWILYPRKEGKSAIKLSARTKLYDYGYETIKKCIERYKLEKEKESWRKWMHGSTFFNGRYEDYLDGNYEPIETSSNINEWEAFLKDE